MDKTVHFSAISSEDEVARSQLLEHGLRGGHGPVGGKLEQIVEIGIELGHQIMPW